MIITILCWLCSMLSSVFAGIALLQLSSHQQLFEILTFVFAAFTPVAIYLTVKADKNNKNK